MGMWSIVSLTVTYFLRPISLGRAEWVAFGGAGIGSPALNSALAMRVRKHGGCTLTYQAAIMNSRFRACGTPKSAIFKRLTRILKPRDVKAWIIASKYFLCSHCHNRPLVCSAVAILGTVLSSQNPTTLLAAMFTLSFLGLGVVLALENG